MRYKEGHQDAAEAEFAHAQALIEETGAAILKPLIIEEMRTREIRMNRLAH
jgi:hypothetical protein